MNTPIQSITQKQVIERHDGIFHRSVEIVLDQSRMKTVEQIQQEQTKEIVQKKPWFSMFSSVKVVNISHSWSWSININL